MGRITIVDAVEAIYSELASASPIDWLSGVLAKIHDCTPGGMGGFAYAYDIAGDPKSWRISRPLVYGAPQAMGDHILRSFELEPPMNRERVFRRLGPAGTFSATTGQLLTTYGSDTAHELGVLDAIHVNALDADDCGVLVSLTIPKPRRLAPAERRRLAMLSAHVAGARRLLLAPRSNPPAIFERDGRVAHLQAGHESALGLLRKQIARIEQAREQRRAEPDDVLSAWQALVGGRYTLVRRIDTDRRHYTVAYENPPGVRDPRGLTETEAAIASWASRGHSHKLIGYELGLSTGTVSGMLSRVFHKLRVRSLPELVMRMSKPTRLSRVSIRGQSLILFSADATTRADWMIGLTAAEREVASRAVHGMSNDAIAEARQTSRRTITNQLTNIFRKLGVHSRAELAALAAQPNEMR